MRVFEGRLFSNEDGSAREEVYPVEGFGLQVSQLLVAVVVQARSGSTVEIELSFDEGAIDDPTPMRSGGTLISSVTPGAPTTLRASSTTPPLPYIRLKTTLLDTNSTLGWLEVAIYAGGRQP